MQAAVWETLRERLAQLLTGHRASKPAARGGHRSFICCNNPAFTGKRKLQITAIGEPAEVLELVEFQAPAPGRGQVLVEVEAATINASDFLYMSGQYFITPQPPAEVGAEGVGRVLAVGPGEDESLVGARVLLLPTYRHGTWATHVIAAGTDIVVVPDDIDTAQLAMAGINPMTALLMLRNYGNPSMPGRWVGQTAGNSAVGEYLIKLAQRFGWKTMSVVRREAAAEQVRSWGGDRVVIDDDNLDPIWLSHSAAPSSTSSSTPLAAAERGSSPTTYASAGRWCRMRCCPGRPPQWPCLI
jgi:NADPH:quinone reductase-like Zn-dependent oxidoreductase